MSSTINQTLHICLIPILIGLAGFAFLQHQMTNIYHLEASTWSRQLHRTQISERQQADMVNAAENVETAKAAAEGLRNRYAGLGLLVLFVLIFCRHTDRADKRTSSKYRCVSSVIAYSAPERRSSCDRG